MGAISSWLLSISGVVILSVLAEFVLPEGQINKYTKVVFAFIILLVVIMPLPKIFGKDLDISKYFHDTELQEDYLYQHNQDKLTAIENSILEKLEAEGLQDIEVSINADIFSNELKIYGVYVDLENYMADKNLAKQKIKSILGEILKSVEVSFNE